MHWSEAAPRNSAAWLGLCLVLYAYSRILEVAPGPFSPLAVVAFHVLPAVAFALFHGAIHYRWRGILVFTAICAVVGNAMENLSIVTGFPFGHYYFAELMGPKVFHVPVLLGMAYIGMSYISWTLARLIIGRPHAAVAGARVVTLPLVASFIMVAWDLAQDPVWATILHGWIWRDGGPWFGVPISNYLGWFLTVFLIYLSFAVYVHRYPVPQSSSTRFYWWPALVFYAVCAAGNLLQAIPSPAHILVQDPSGAQWRSADITDASALISIFAMGAFVVFAGIRLAEEQRIATD